MSADIEAGPSIETDNYSAANSLHDAGKSESSAPCRRKFGRIKDFRCRPLGSLMLCLWTFCLLCFLAWLLGLQNANYSMKTGTACTSDDTFTVFKFYRLRQTWTKRGFFQITMRMSPLSFTEVKIIDMAWNLIVGRGGQALIVYFTWKNVAYFVATSMEMEPVTYNTFSIVFIHPESTFSSTYKILRDKSFYQSIRMTGFLPFILVSLLFALLFPTATNSMAGYVGKTEALMQDYDERGSQNYIKFSKFNVVKYIIHDGSRINLNDDAIVEYHDSSSNLDGKYDPLLGAGWCSVYDITNRTDCDWKKCALNDRLDHYVAKYGLGGLFPGTSTWENITLQSPSLNISWFPNCTMDNFLKDDELEASNITYTYSNKTYSLSYISSNGICYPVPDIYQWGFSYMQVSLFTGLLFAWTLGNWLSWRIHLPLAELPDGIPMGLKSFLHIASAINHDLAAASLKAPEAYTSRQIEELARKELDGGNVSFKPLDRCGVQA